MARSSFEAIPDNNDDNKNDDTSGSKNVNNDNNVDDNNHAKKINFTTDDSGVVGFTSSELTTSSSKSSNSNNSGIGFSASSFGKPKQNKKKTYVAIGTPPINDIQKPEYDKDGYMLYTDETTGNKSRVFEALVKYPSIFQIKIVGQNDDTFVSDIVNVVKTTCQGPSKEYTIDDDQFQYKTKQNGKWISVTVSAPVQNAEMLYELYENIDLDKRVRFKF